MSRSHSQDQELVQLEHGEWDETEHAAQSLPQVDGGKQAWLFLSACFMLEALVWGRKSPLNLSDNVLKGSQASHSPMASSKSTTATTHYSAKTAQV